MLFYSSSLQSSQGNYVILMLFNEKIWFRFPFDVYGLFLFIIYYLLFIIFIIFIYFLLSFRLNLVLLTHFTWYILIFLNMNEILKFINLVSWSNLECWVAFIPRKSKVTRPNNSNITNFLLAGFCLK